MSKELDGKIIEGRSFRPIRLVHVEPSDSNLGQLEEIEGEVPPLADLPKIVHIDEVSNPYSLRRRYRKFVKEHPHFIESVRRAKEDAVLFYDSNGTKILRGVGAAVAIVGLGAVGVVVYKHRESHKK